MSRVLLIVLCKDRQMNPRGQQRLMLILLPCCGCSWYEYFCICSYTDEVWQRQWFSCHLGSCNVICWPWQVMGVHVTESGVWARLCVHCFVEKDTRVLTPKHHSCRTFLSSTSYRRDMLWPHPAHLHKITLYWYTKVNGIMYKQVLDAEIESIYLWLPRVIYCLYLFIATETAFRLVWTLRPSIYTFSCGTLISSRTSNSRLFRHNDPFTVDPCVSVTVRLQHWIFLNSLLT